VHQLYFCVFFRFCRTTIQIVLFLFSLLRRSYPWSVKRRKLFPDCLSGQLSCSRVATSQLPSSISCEGQLLMEPRVDIRPLMRSNYALLPTDVFSVILGFFANAPRILRIFRFVSFLCDSCSLTPLSRLVCKRWRTLISKIPVEFMVHSENW
jgi:hypothetical protein